MDVKPVLHHAAPGCVCKIKDEKKIFFNLLFIYLFIFDKGDYQVCM